MPSLNANLGLLGNFQWGGNVSVTFNAVLMSHSKTNKPFISARQGCNKKHRLGQLHSHPPPPKKKNNNNNNKLTLCFTFTV